MAVCCLDRRHAGVDDLEAATTGRAIVRSPSVLQRVVVAPVTTKLREARSQLPLGIADDLPVESVGNFDNLATVPKSMLVRRLGSLGHRHLELCATPEAMAGC